MDNIIEVCPKCGSDLNSMTLLCNPPIYKKKCTNPDCCWDWESQPNVIRVPFDEYKQQDRAFKGVVMIERTEACVDCKYWDCYESDLNNINELTDGSCHRYPPNAPSVSGVSDIGTLMYESPFRGVQLLEHPITFAFDWCGEFCPNK